MKILISVGKSADPINYVRAVEKAGGTPCALYLPEPDLSCDGLILAGGGDVEPSRFGQENRGSDNMNPARDRAELALLDAFAAAGKPILGICRGHQAVNVWAGGTLIQDLGEKNAVHRWEERDKIHWACAEKGVLRDLYGERFCINSAHHQAVDAVGKDLEITACSEDGVVEAMEHRTLPILTVQFHPERMTGPETADGARLFQWFLKRCEEK